MQQTKTKCETDGREEEPDDEYYLDQRSPAVAVLNLTCTDKRQRKVRQVRLFSSMRPRCPWCHLTLPLVLSTLQLQTGHIWLRVWVGESEGVLSLVSLVSY